MSGSEAQVYRTRIRADQPWWKIDWHEILEYRDLIWLLVQRDFASVYKQTVLGPLWFVVQPLATTVVFTVVFGRIAQIGTDGIPPFVFYMSGTVLWNYFAGCMNGASNSLIGNASLFQKVYFPRLIISISQVFSQLLYFLFNMAVFLSFYFYYLFLTDARIHPSWWILALPLLVAQSAIVGTGVGLWLSALTVKYRDLRFMMAFLTQLWMYATPIIYPASKIPERWRWWISLNPMASVVEFNRFAFFGVASLTKSEFLCGVASGIFLLVTGVLVFNRVQRNFVDTV
jgi:lipopolysaccharide transport system permease protein